MLLLVCVSIWCVDNVAWDWELKQPSPSGVKVAITRGMEDEMQSPNICDR